MKLCSGKSSDWWAKIDPDKEERFRQVFFQAPDLASQFPVELLDSMKRGFGWGYEGETPDEKSFEHWTKYPRLSVLKEGDKRLVRGVL